MIGNKIGHRLDPYIHSIIKRLFGHRGNPNFFTLMGFLATLLASFLIVRGSWFLAGLAILLSGIFDLFDGVIARTLNKVTPFGGFLDSVTDRYSDLILLLSYLVYYLKGGDSTTVILIFFVSIGTAVIPYTRARAEAARIQCSAGLMERAERITLIAIGTFFGLMEPVLWVLALLTHFTVLERIYHVWKKMKEPLK